MRCVSNKILFTSSKHWLALMGLLSIFAFDIQAEGIQQLAPTAADSPVMLESGRPDFANFAAFDGPENGRLYISIGSPDEVVYIGLSIEYDDRGQPYSNNFSAAQYRFRIKRVDGGMADPVVHGPFKITNTSANLTTWNQAVFGNYDVTVLEDGNLIYEFHPGQAGDYYIEFDDISTPDSNDNLPDYRKVNIGLWDITVTDNGIPIDGRVWSRNWALRTPELNGDMVPDCEWDRPFKGTFYSYTTDGFVSKIDFSDAGMQGLTFLVAFNSTGPGISGDLSQDRMSIPGANATANASEHRIFLSPPDPNIFISGLCGTIESAASFQCSGIDSFCIEVTVSKPGQVELIIDFNQNGILDPASQDVSIVYEFTEGMLSSCIPWDGLRGDGSPIGITDTVDLIFNYAQGIQHWSAYDVEFMRNGYCIETIRPICSAEMVSNQLYWDDRNIPEDPGTGALKDGRNGCDCSLGCRSWDNFNINSPSCINVNDNNTTGYGDKTTLNTWWFATSIMTTRANIPLVNIMVTGPDSVCAGETATYVALDEGTTGTTTYQWSGPAGFSANSATINIDMAGEYCVTISDELGCTSNACKTLTVLDSGIGTIAYPNNINACLNTMISIMPSGNTSGFSFLWSPTTGGITDPSLPTQTIDFTGNVSYIVEITNDATSCSFLDTITVMAFPDPVAAFVAETGCELGLEVNFTNQSTNAVAYAWDFGVPDITTDTSTDPSPSYTYPAVGDYQVVLTVTSADGCESSITQTVAVIDIPLAANFDVSYGSCNADSVVVQLTNTSVNGANNTDVYSWSFNVPPLSSNEENPTFTLSTSQSVTALLTIITLDGCSSSISQTFDVYLGPTINQFPDSLFVCSGESVQIMPGGNPDFSYSWSPLEGIDDPTSPQPVFNPVVSTIYTVTITATGVDECTLVETVAVIVPGDINLQVDGGGTFCTPTTTLTALTDVAATIIWQNTNGDSIGTGNTLTVDISGDMDYIVVATDDFGCAETISNITASGGPVDFTAPDTVAVCLGEEVVLSITNLDINDVLTYSWTPVELFAPGTATDAVPDYLETVGTQEVAVQLTNQYGCTATTSIHVAVVDPDINLGFTSLIDCMGGTVSFTNTSTNAFAYVWDFGDGNGSFEENPIHVYAQGGAYTVTLDIIYDVNCLAEPFVQEIMVETPVILADFTYDITVCSADSATIQFFDNSSNSLNNTIEWVWTFNDGTPATSSLQNPVVTVFNTAPLIVSFTIITANDCNNTYTDTLAIQLVDLDISLSDTIVVCSGFSTTLNPDGDPELIYNWTPAGSLDDPTAASPIATPAVTTTYFVTAYSLVGADTCFVADSVVVFIPEDINLVLDQEPVVITCGEDVTITATTDVAVDIVWTSTLDGILDETGNSITLNPFRTDTIIATVTDQYGCTAMDSVIINDTGVDINIAPGTDLVICDDVETVLTVVNLDDEDELTYQWTPEEYIVGPDNQASVMVRINALGEFVVTAVVSNQYGCVDTVDITLLVETFTGVPLDSIIVCANEPTPINPGSDPDLVYNWSPNDEFIDLSDPSNPIVTTEIPLTYYVTITDTEFGCTAIDSVFIDISPQMNLTVTPLSTILCSEGTVTLTANTNVDPVNIDWFLLPGDIPVGNGVDITFTPPLGASLVYAVASSAAGCTERDTVSINNFPIDATITAPIIFCDPTATVDLEIDNLDEDQTLTIVWDVDPPFEGPVITVDLAEGETAFSATVTNQFGCSETLNTVITVIDLLGNMNIVAEPDSILLNESSTITVTGCVGCTYEWDPAAEDSPVITVTPTESGEIFYTVTASLLGCETTLEVSVFVLEAMCTVDFLYFPNAFTPNGDGENDVIRLRSNFIEELLEYELLIYDRWGGEIFRSTNPFDYWDGTFRNEALAPDVYGYYLRVLCPMGEELIQKGNITLLR